MRKLMALVMVLASSMAFGQSLNGKPFIAVQGHAEVELVPDTFPVTVTLSETSTDTALAQKNIEGLASQIVELTERMKVPEKDVRVGNMNVDAETRYDDKKEEDVFVGNSYERVIKVTFHSLGELRYFIAALPSGKNLKVETGTFSHSKERQLKTELVEAAIRDARLRAERMASAVGKRLLELHNVSDRSQGVTYSYVGYSANIGAVDVQGTAMLAPGTVRGPRIILREGTVKLETDAYLVYLIGD